MKTINCNGVILDLTKPVVMGILNVTPDSFYDGGRQMDVESALLKAHQYLSEGAKIIDVGGMSSRPGAKLINIEEEKVRVIPVIKRLREEYPNIIISIDTVHGEVARAAIKSGANMVNDISAGSIDIDIWKACIDMDTPYVMMHMQGIPENMQNSPAYNDVVLDILNYLKDKHTKLISMGMKDIIIDPGFGFGKSIVQNYKLLKRLKSFQIFECPIMVGISRKSMIYKMLKVEPEMALNGTTAVHMLALANGANILRVHDVKEAIECIQIHEQMTVSK